jgi:uncharacterized protein
VFRIDLTRIDGEPIEFSERVTLPAECGGEDVLAPGEATITGRVEKSEEGYTVEATVEGRSEVRCVRCLAAFPLTYLERFAVRLCPVAQVPLQEDLHLGPDELEVRFLEEPTLDLADLAAEQFQLVLPMKPLCDEKCQGLCSRCGADLNRGRCACPANVDSRWTPLRAWRSSR